MQATIRSELWELTADLAPAAPVATTPATTLDRSGELNWPASTVIAVTALIGSLVVAGGLMLMLGLVSPLLFAGAVVGGSAAAVGGASLAYLSIKHVSVHGRRAS